MKFRMNCPKCGSTNFSIERDNRSYAPRGQTFEMIFSCRCGKQMFGEQIVKEYERQKKDWEATVSAEERQEPAQDERRPAAQAHAADEDLEEADDLVDEDADLDEDERPAARSRSAVAGSASSDEEDGEEDGEDSDVCGWHPCSNPPRPNSKYCSRDCSNKNARWRYKQRKAAEKEAA